MYFTPSATHSSEQLGFPHHKRTQSMLSNPLHTRKFGLGELSMGDSNKGGALKESAPSCKFHCFRNWRGHLSLSCSVPLSRAAASLVASQRHLASMTEYRNHSDLSACHPRRMLHKITPTTRAHGLNNSTVCTHKGG